MTRGDAEKMLSDLVKRGRRQTDSLLEASSSGWSNRRAKRSAAGPSRCANRRPRPRAARAKNSARWSRPPVRSRRPRPRRGELLEVEIDSLAFGGRGVARADGLVVFVSGALPGDRVRAEITKGEEALRRGAHGRAAAARRRPRRRPLRPRAASPAPAPPGRASPTSASWPTSSEQVDEALRRIGGLDGFELEEIEPARRAVALPQQARVLLRRARRRADPRLPRPRPLGPDRRRRRLPARLRARQRRPQRGPRMGAAGVGPRLRPPRRASGVLRNLVVREGRRTGQIQTRLVTSAAPLPQAAGRPAHGDRGRLRRHRRPDRRARRGAAARGALRPAAGDVPRRLLPDQHRDGRAPLRGRRRVRRAERQRAGLRPLLRDRHDRADDGRRRPARSGAWRSSPRRSPTPSATPSATRSRTPASSPATPAPACGR